MRNLVATVAAAAALPLCVPAQGHTTTLPAPFTGTTSPTGNMTLPLGRSRGFMQTWYRGDALPLGTVVSAIGWRADESSSGPAQTIQIEIVLDNTPVSHAGITNVFAQNLGAAPTTFLPLGPVNLPAFTPPTNVDQPPLWFAGVAPFVFTGPHLIVQVDVQTAATASSTSYNVDGFSQAAGAPLHTRVETSCGGALTASYSGGSWNVLVTGATPGAPVFLLVGVDNRLFAGAIPLPWNLAPFQMPNCVLALDPLMSIGLLADAGGNASLSIPYALGNDTLVLYTQAAHPAPVNPAGLATTNLAGSILGITNFATYLYNYTVFGPTAQYGPYANSRAGIVFVR